MRVRTILAGAAALSLLGVLPVTAGASARDRADAARIAHGQLGYHEHGTNCTKYQKACAEWCDAFASWVFKKAGLSGKTGGFHAYVPDHVSWFKRHHQWGKGGSKKTGPVTGAAIFYDLNGHSGADHVGIVYDYNSTYVWAVDGNYRDAVRLRKIKRTSSAIYGYGYDFRV